jgi:hypothetical protein
MRLNKKDREAATQAMLLLSRIITLSKSGYNTVGGYSYAAGSKESLTAIRDSACQVSEQLVRLLSGGEPTEVDARQAVFTHSSISVKGWISDLVSRRTVLDDLVDALDEGDQVG